VLSARDSGEPVGVIGWWSGNPTAETALLGMLMMTPDRRGAGLAREAVVGLERWLADRGITRMRTAVGAKAFAEHRLLRALGFELLPVREHTALGMAGSHLMLWEKSIAGTPRGTEENGT
jgi:GNAT superfamily N-acetyltransferase